MRDDAASPPMMEHTTSVYTYETVDTISAVAVACQHILSTRIEQVALVIIKLHYENEEKVSPERLAQMQQGAVHLLNSLRPLVRKTDSVFLLGHAMYFLLLGANEQGGQIVQNRLWEALLWRVHNIFDRDILRPRGMSIGHSAYPEHHANIDEFIEEAGNASARFDCQPGKPARKAAARQARLSAEHETNEELPALARKLGIPYLSLLPRKLPHGLQNIVNPKLAQELRCYPIGRERNILTVAMLNPEDRAALDRLQQETGLHIFPVLTHPLALQTILEQLL